MSGIVGSFQQSAFATPVNGAPGDASVVLGNDNATVTKHNGHDADPTIHVQSSLLSARPGAGTAQRLWVTTDGKRAYLDNGAGWDEVAYLPLAGGTVTGPVVLGSTLTVGGATTITGTTTVVGNVIVNSATVSTLFVNTTSGAVSDVAEIAFARGGASKWTVGNNLSGANADDLQIVSVALGTVIASWSNSTGLLSLSNGLTVTGTVTATAFSGPLTGNVTGSATSLTTGRTIAITGDLAYTSPTFDGTGNVTAAGTLATVNANVGSFGSSTAIPTFTVNGKGLITAASTAVVVAPAGTLSGATLASGVTASSLTSTGILTSVRLLTGGASGQTGHGTFGAGGTLTITNGTTSATSSVLVSAGGTFGTSATGLLSVSLGLGSFTVTSSVGAADSGKDFTWLIIQTT